VEILLKVRNVGNVMETYFRTALLRQLPSRSILYLTLHKQLFLEVLQGSPESPWDWFNLHKNINFTFEWVNQFPDKGWNWMELTRKMECICQLIQYKDKPLDWEYLTLSNDFDIELIMKTAFLPWHFGSLFFTNIRELELLYIRQFIQAYNEPESWDDHSQHIQWSYVKNNLDLPWNIREIRFDVDSFLPTDVDIITRTPHIDWDYCQLSGIVHADIIMQNKNLWWWNWSFVSGNQTLELRHVEMNPEIPWDYDFAPINPDLNKWIAANCIKTQWKKSVTDPSYLLCRKMLLRQFHELDFIGN